MPGDDVHTNHDFAGQALPPTQAGASATGPADGAYSASRGPSVGALRALSTLAAVICAAVVTQVFLAGLGLLVDHRYIAWHEAFVHMMELPALALIVLGAAARAGAGLFALSAAPVLLIGAQYALIHGFDGPPRALHAVNAFVIFGVGWALAARSSHAANAAADAARTAGAGAASRLGLTVAAMAALMVGTAGVLADQGGSGPAAQAPAGVADDAASDRGTEQTGDAGRATEAPADAGGSAEAPASMRGGAGAQSDAALGARVFAENCSGCHGSRGEGRIGPRLSGNRALADRDYVVERVTSGGGIMPPFGRVLSDGEVEAVVDHVRSSWGNDF